MTLTLGVHHLCNQQQQPAAGVLDGQLCLKCHHHPAVTAQVDLAASVYCQQRLSSLVTCWMAGQRLELIAQDLHLLGQKMTSALLPLALLRCTLPQRNLT